jgi:hypothetical protein
MRLRLEGLQSVRTSINGPCQAVSQLHRRKLKPFITRTTLISSGRARNSRHREAGKANASGVMSTGLPNRVLGGSMPAEYARELIGVSQDRIPEGTMVLRCVLRIGKRGYAGDVLR